MVFDPIEMALRGRIGAYTLHSRSDSRETTAAARAAFLARFEREVDADGVLPAEERQRRATAARRAYFARLALRSARARRRREPPAEKSSGTPRHCGADTAEAEVQQ
jgi:hypothetical protein